MKTKEVTREDTKNLLHEHSFFRLETLVNTLEVENRNGCLYLRTRWNIGHNKETTQRVSEDDVISWLHRNYESVQVIQ